MVTVLDNGIRRKVVGLLVIAGISIQLIVLCSVILIALFRMNYLGDNIVMVGEELEMFQVLKVDREGKTASFGMIELDRRHFSGNRFYQDSEGNFNLISNIGDDEYVCRGTCYCQQNKFHSDRRTSTTSTISSIFFLVAAVSSIIAKKQAEEYFSQECKSNMEDKCPSHAIRSEVSDCDETSKSLPKISSDDSRQMNPHDCYGKCVNRVFELNQPKRDFVQPQARTFRCTDLDMSLTINVPVVEMRKLSDLDYARRVFVQNLNPYCEKNSQKDIIYFSETEKGKIEKNKVNMCVGEWDINAWNPTIVCRPSNVVDLFPK